MVDNKYDYWYPLIDWNMDRDACKAAIRSVGLPVPPKSACKFCPATQPAELLTLRKEYLRYIVIMEAWGKPNLLGCMTVEQLQKDFEIRHLAWQDKIAIADGKKLTTLLHKEPKLKDELLIKRFLIV